MIPPSGRNGPSTRSAILQAVRASPGLTKSDLCRLTGLAWSTVAYHVRVLERGRTLIQNRRFGRRRLFLAVAAHAGAKIAALWDELGHRILDDLGSAPERRINEVTRGVGASRKVISRYLSGFVEAGYVERTGDYHPRFMLRHDLSARRPGSNRLLVQLEATGEPRLPSGLDGPMP